MSILHAIKPPEFAHRRLTDLVLLQIALLTYAARAKSINTKTCSNYLIKTANFAECGAAIAHWFFDSRATKRQSLLRKFATTYKKTGADKHIQEFRSQWLVRICQEVESLLDSEGEYLRVGPFYVDEETGEECKKENAPAWQKAAAEFFLYFYENYLGGSETFPPAIFTGLAISKFGRNDVLQDFIRENADLEICAICDQARYYVHGEEKIHSILDHYFPKETYPHFACHPYNLIPVCYTCNSSIKGKKDPFLDTEGQRRQLRKKSLPYRQRLADAVYLAISPGSGDKMVTIGQLCSQASGGKSLPPDIEEAIDLLQEIYQIPDNWGCADQSMRIHDVLFRRIRHFLDEGRTVQHGTQVETEIYNALRQLLYYLAVDDQRRDPFGFALTWMLGAYLKEKDKVHSSSWKALNAEINSWSGQSLDKSIERDNFVKDLLERLP